MPLVELPLGLEGSEDFPRSRRTLTNCFNNQQGQIMPRPGIESLATSAAVARGQFVWNESLYQIIGETLVRVTDVDTGATTLIGTIAGSAITHTEIGFNTATIVVSASSGASYTLDKSDVLVDISGNANIVANRTLAHIDGRFVYIPFDGSPAYFSDVGAAGTVQALSFFDAEELPDLNRTVFNFDGTLYIGGTDSIEQFRNTGASPNPFQRITGARISVGFIDGLLEYNNSFLFVGRQRDQESAIFVVTKSGASKISNQVVDLIVSEIEFTDLEQDTVTVARFIWRGFDIAVFTIAQTSFGFFAGQWFFLETIGDTGSPGAWGGGFVTQFFGTYFTAFLTFFGKLDNINTDYGDPIIYTIDTAFQHPDNDRFGAQSIDVTVTQGFSSVAASVGLFTSRNNVEYSDGVFRALGALGEYGQHMSFNYPGGLGIYNGFLGIRLQTSARITFKAAMSMTFRG